VGTTGVITQEPMRTRTASEKSLSQQGTAHRTAIHWCIPMVRLQTKNTQKFPYDPRAIDDNTTLSGHHIRVKPGAYREHLYIDKALSVSSSSHYVAFLNGCGMVLSLPSAAILCLFMVLPFREWKWNTGCRGFDKCIRLLYMGYFNLLQFPGYSSDVTSYGQPNYT